MQPDQQLAFAVVDWQAILLAIVAGVIGLMSTISTVIGSIYLAKINARLQITLNNSNATRARAEETATSVEKIHVAVNSERAAMLKKLEEMHAEILRLSTANAELGSNVTKES